MVLLWVRTWLIYTSLVPPASSHEKKGSGEIQTPYYFKRNALRQIVALQFEQKHCVAKMILYKCHWHALIGKQGISVLVMIGICVSPDPYFHVKGWAMPD